MVGISKPALRDVQIGVRNDAMSRLWSGAPHPGLPTRDQTSCGLSPICQTRQRPTSNVHREWNCIDY
jgi:hypothetical protein